MNSLTQQFLDIQLEAKYFENQYSELLNFYLWTCYLGTFSSISVFLMEFASPFNFGDLKYILLFIPFLFLISYRIIRKCPNYFNFILGSINLSLGLVIDILLILFINSDYLFLAGQTVALVQYSLLIGTNVLANLVILVINQVALIIINSYFQNNFKSLQIMFIFALVLVMKSIWTNSKMKRQFFIQTYLNKEMQNSLDNCFDIGIAKCMFDVRSQQIKLISTNQCMSKQFIRQKEFTEFIREYSLTQSQRFNFRNLQQTFASNQPYHTSSSLTLELFLFKEFNRKSKDLQTQFEIQSKTKNINFKVCLQSTIKKEQMVIILMILEQTQMKKIRHLQSKLKDKQQNLRSFVVINKQIRQVVQNIQFIIHKNSKLQQLQQQFQSPLSILYDMLHSYYNILLINRYIKLGNIISFHIEKLLIDIQQIEYHDFLQKDVVLEYFFDKSLICSTDYLLLQQLLLNILKIHSIRLNHIQMKIRQIQIENIYCLQFEFVLLNYIEFYTKAKFDLNYDIINTMILKLIGWNTDIISRKLQTSLSLQFCIIQDLNQFQNALQK